MCTSVVDKHNWLSICIIYAYNYHSEKQNYMIEVPLLYCFTTLTI